MRIINVYDLNWLHLYIYYLDKTEDVTIITVCNSEREEQGGKHTENEFLSSPGTSKASRRYD